MIEMLLTCNNNNSRLLDEHGIHHGPEKKKDVDVDADKDVHKKAAGTDHNKVQETGTGHKGLGEKIKGKTPPSSPSPSRDEEVGLLTNVLACRETPPWSSLDL